MHGTTKIELTNIKTGEKEVIQHDNMMTNAIKDLLQLNPCAMLYKQSNYDNFFPLIGKLLGGIQLFAKPLTENANIYYSPHNNPITGYASMDVNTTNDTHRGSLNQTESGWLTGRNGYKFVWDFNTSQGNGTISSLGLCDVNGGKDALGEDFVYNTKLQLVGSSTTLYSGHTNLMENLAFQGIIHLVPEENYAYSVFWSENKTIKIYKISIPITSYLLKDDLKLRSSIDWQEITTINTETFGYSSNSAAYLSFAYDENGYIWGFQHNNNTSGNSSGNAIIQWIKIDMNDWSYQEGTWTLDATICQFGYKNKYPYGYHKPSTNCIIYNDYLYCLKYDRYGVYKINLNDSTDIVLLQDEDSTSHKIRSFPYVSDNYGTTLFNLVGNTIILPRGCIVNDIGYGGGLSSLGVETFGTSRTEAPKLHYGPFIFSFFSYHGGYPNSGVSAYLNIYRTMTYLATINNLSQPVEKTSDKTMKITYTITDTE